MNGLALIIDVTVLIDVGSDSLVTEPNVIANAPMLGSAWEVGCAGGRRQIHGTVPTDMESAMREN